MAKLVVIVIVAIAASITWAVRKAQARRRLREIDEGRRCVACDATDLTRMIHNVRCNRCGYVASLAALERAQLSEQEISNLTSPDDGHRF